MGGELTESSPEVKDLGVFVDEKGVGTGLPLRCLQLKPFSDSRKTAVNGMCNAPTETDYFLQTNSTYEKHV